MCSELLSCFWLQVAAQASAQKLPASSGDLEEQVRSLQQQLANSEQLLKAKRSEMDRQLVESEEVELGLKQRLQDMQEQLENALARSVCQL